MSETDIGFTPEQLDQLARLGDASRDQVAGPFPDGSVVLCRDIRKLRPVRIGPGGTWAEFDWTPLP